MKKSIFIFIILFTLFPMLVHADDIQCVYSDDRGNRYTLIIKNKSVNMNLGSIIASGKYTDFESGCPEEIQLCQYTGSGGNIYKIQIGSCMEVKNQILTGSTSLLRISSSEPVDPIVDVPDDAKVINCKALFGDPDESKYIAYWLQWAMNVIKYLGIIALFIMSTIDFVKALIDKDQDAVKKAASTTLKRFIYCVILFFLPIIVETLMSLIGAYGTCNIG